MPFLTDWRVIGTAVLVLAVAAYIVTLRLERDHYRNEFVEERAAFLEFKDETMALAEKARKAAAATEAADKNRKEAADAENAAALDTLAGSIKRLRDERDRARRGLLSTAAAGAGDPDTVCFDRPLVERAYGELVTRLRDLADEGSKAVMDLDTAKRWAH